MARSTKQLSVTLPTKMAQQVRARVAAGAYASESEVIREGLRALDAREKAIENWLRTEVVETHDAMQRNPKRARSVKQVRASLAKAHQRAAKKA